ncbi:hypothetical protein [Halorussus amylolyticus]|uniref:hypothetical protein n=1 Tax=Halorussus amylolyticus TaxID=1126242 RepID=UPI0010435043|nr:hypothetical protein [Halorussus amylolyticus]
MARDKTAGENDSETSLLDRRSYLKLAGAAAASVAAVNVSSGSADAADYETIEIPAGERRTFNVGSGETFENKIIDISADGAHFKLMTSGSGWTVRNIGVRGENNDRSDTFACFYCRADSGGEGLVENVYMGDGSVDRCGHAAFSGYGNAGHVTLRNVHVQGWSADGMYLSQPGVPGNSGGTFTIERAFAKNNNIENIRIGTEGSEIRDSVVHVEGTGAVTANESGQKNPRGIWFKEESGLLARNCDVQVSGADAVYGGGGQNGGGTLQNCRVEGSIRGNVTEESVSGSPDITPPDSVPMSAEEAASGGSESGGTTQAPTTEQESDDSGDSDGTVLELISADGTENVGYAFTVEGDVSKHESSDGHAANDNDTITDNGDGTVSVDGLSGNSYGDAYLVNGTVTAMEADESNWTLRYGGEEVTAADLTDAGGSDGDSESLPKKLVIDGSNRPRGATTYTFEVDGEVEKSAELGSINAFDTASDGEISGRVVGGADGYRFSGTIVGFELDGPANVRVENGS